MSSKTNLSNNLSLWLGKFLPKRLVFLRSHIYRSKKIIPKTVTYLRECDSWLNVRSPLHSDSGITSPHQALHNSHVICGIHCQHHLLKPLWLNRGIIIRSASKIFIVGGGEGLNIFDPKKKKKKKDLNNFEQIFRQLLEISRLKLKRPWKIFKRFNRWMKIKTYYFKKNFYSKYYSYVTELKFPPFPAVAIFSRG